LGGQLTFTFEPLVTGIPMIKANKLRGFAVSGIKRSKGMPSLPTMNELGYKGFDITQFQGLLAPAGTDPAIIRRLHAEAVKALKSPAVIRRLVDDGGNEIVGGTPTEFAQQIQSDLRLYGKLITAANINAE
jgi:tripartite-type tricarboxylate transporter receptor subunit TctC